MPGPIQIPCYMKQKIPFRALLIASKWDFLLHLAANAKKGRLPIYAKQPSAEYPAEDRGHRYATVAYTAARLDETYTALPKLTPNRMPSPSSLPVRLTRTGEPSRNRGAKRRALPRNEFHTNRRRQWHLRRESGLSEIERQGPAPGPSVPVYESDVLSNSLKSFGLPLPRLAFMHWPTKKPMTFWLPSRYCCA